MTAFKLWANRKLEYNYIDCPLIRLPLGEGKSSFIREMSSYEGYIKHNNCFLKLGSLHRVAIYRRTTVVNFAKLRLRHSVLCKSLNSDI